MIVKGIIDEDFVNYKYPCMTIEFPYCTFKCDKECGKSVCQNSKLATAPNINISYEKIVQRYISNSITRAMCFQGLEPFDSWHELYEFIQRLRKRTVDDIVIYTGYNKNEIDEKIKILSEIENIIIKFGRFIPNQNPHYDCVLGVNLSSDNQYAIRL